MTRRRGFAYAQLDAHFLADPKFVKLARTANSHFLEAVGLWVIALAHAWASDDPDVSDVLAEHGSDDTRGLLERCHLIEKGVIPNYDSWTDDVRSRREHDAERKRRQRSPQVSRGTERDNESAEPTQLSTPVTRSPAESRGVRERPAESRVGEGRGGESISQAPTAVPAREAKKPSVKKAEPRLTKAQLDAWATFGPEWSHFKEAWLARGFLFPPAGSAEDDDTSQRGLLYQVLDAWPTGIAAWVREAPGTTPRAVIDHVLARWHEKRDEAGIVDEAPPLKGDPPREEAAESVRSIMARMSQESASP